MLRLQRQRNHEKLLGDGNVLPAFPRVRGSVASGRGQTRYRLSQEARDGDDTGQIGGAGLGAYLGLSSRLFTFERRGSRTNYDSPRGSVERTRAPSNRTFWTLTRRPAISRRRWPRPSTAARARSCPTAASSPPRASRSASALPSRSASRVSPDGQTAATINSGASRFSVTLVRGLRTRHARRPRSSTLDATFMGVVFSPDGARFFASGGENGNIWVGDTASGTIIGSVNLNGAAHPLDRPLAPATDPAAGASRARSPATWCCRAMASCLYVVDQGSFQVHVIDTHGDRHRRRRRPAA